MMMRSAAFELHINQLLCRCTVVVGLEDCSLAYMYLLAHQFYSSSWRLSEKFLPSFVQIYGMPAPDAAIIWHCLQRELQRLLVGNRARRPKSPWLKMARRKRKKAPVRSLLLLNDGVKRNYFPSKNDDIICLTLTNSKSHQT